MWGLTVWHSAAVTKVLGGLRDREVLTMVGARRGARYQLGPVAVDPPDSADTGVGDPNGIETDVSLEGGQGDSKGSGPSSHDSPANSQDSRELDGHSKEESSERWRELRAIAAGVEGRRYLSARTRDDLVVRLCAVTPLSAEEIATLLGRSAVHMRAVVRSLVADGRLAYRYPDRPNHPRQQYVAPLSEAGSGTRA